MTQDRQAARDVPVHRMVTAVTFAALILPDPIRMVDSRCITFGRAIR
jgi:hypothetical protein